MEDYPKFYRERMVRARKTHKCCECHSDILIGEMYNSFTGLWDDFGTWKTCFHCLPLRDEVNKTLKCYDRLCFGELENYMYRNNTEFSKRWFDICTIRGIVIPDWLFDRLNKNKQAVLVIKDLLKK